MNNSLYRTAPPREGETVPVSPGSSLPRDQGGPARKPGALDDSATVRTDDQSAGSFAVTGSWGDLSVDSGTGEIEYNPGGDYANITRFDVEEWKRTYPRESLAGMTLDILDIGFWTASGYCPPEEQWREEWQNELKEKED